MLTPYREAKFEPHTGPFLFEFQRHAMSNEEFCSRLDIFFEQLPKDFQYAVEIRNAGLLGPDYRKVLEITASRLSTTIGPTCRGYGNSINGWRIASRRPSRSCAAKKRAASYTKIVEELPDMRRDTVELVKKAIGENRRAYVLVNNRSEENASLTIQALRNALQATETWVLPISILACPGKRKFVNSILNQIVSKQFVKNNRYNGRPRERTCSLQAQTRAVNDD